MQPLPEPTAEQVSLFEKMSKKLRFKYRPEDFDNPSLHSFFTNLEALVYDEEAKEIVDLTMPEYELQDQKIEPFLQEIENEFGTVCILWFMSSVIQIVDVDSFIFIHDV